MLLVTKKNYSPILVLDFQSLYPSMIIAYNLCFSTCLGKIKLGNKRLGTLSQYALPQGLLSTLGKDIFVTPNGVMFVKETVCAGILPRMLHEIISTRVMVKKAMKQTKDDPIMTRILNARQFGLKMISNVTYGYTSANFSGRMPMSELADSIVQLGRQTLENAIRIVEETKRWKARVVYGDTDSLFVELPGASKQEAFRIGKEIAAKVTMHNPSPVKLQFEKVFHPCFLVTKKRYVGYMYEHVDQGAPVFDAKGIETVRRDNCKAVATMLEKSIRIMFETQDISLVKQYSQRQWTKIMKGRVNIQDFIFAKEVKLGTYSAKGPLPPAALVAKQAMQQDPRSEPLYRQRVPYVVVYGNPRARLIDLVVDPLFYMKQSPNLQLNATYYITKQIIPAMDRIFSLIGVHVKSWFDEMPKIHSTNGWRMLKYYVEGNICNDGRDPRSIVRTKRMGTIDSYFSTRICMICETGQCASSSNKTISRFVCQDCLSEQQQTGLLLHSRLWNLERHEQALARVCSSCIDSLSLHSSNVVNCEALECPIWHQRQKVKEQLECTRILLELFTSPL